MKTKNIIYIVVLITIGLLIFFVFKLTSAKYYESKDYTWYSEIGTKDGDLLVRGKKIDRIKNDINKLIYAINGTDKNPEIFRTPEGKEPLGQPKLKLIGIKGQVIDIEVINDEYLTQRMGSMGAAEYLATATFTLTEYDNIKFVNFIFEPGDHAFPGVYSREDLLANWKTVE
jgi:hypothetical protein